MSVHAAIETRLAFIGWASDGILVIRFKEDAPADLAGIREIVETRNKLSAGRQAPVMVLLAAGMDFEIQVPTTDHAAGSEANTLAEATVAPTHMLDKIARMYYQYFPRPFPTAVFATEADARAWLQQHPAA